MEFSSRTKKMIQLAQLGNQEVSEVLVEPIKHTVEETSSNNISNLEITLQNDILLDDFLANEIILANDILNKESTNLLDTDNLVFEYPNAQSTENPNEKISEFIVEVSESENCNNMEEERTEDEGIFQPTTPVREADNSVNENSSTEEQEIESDSDTYKPDDESDNNSDSNKSNFGRGRKRRKLLKDSGKEYVNTTGRKVAAKTMRENPCKDKCVNECHLFSPEDRENIFNYYWDLKDSNNQKRFLADCVVVSNVKRRRHSKKLKNRTCTNEYYLSKDDVRRKVCRQFLINTLSITVRTLRTVSENKKPKKFPEIDLRGKHHPPHKTSDEQMQAFTDFVNSLPLVPSHYCRKSSSRKYLPADVKSFNNLHRMYVKDQQEKKKTPLKKIKFLQLLKKNFNIGIHVPRKDKCIKCLKFSNLPEHMKNENELATYNKHIEEKEIIKKDFLTEQKLALEEANLMVASFDLQKVLATPHGDNLVLGFSRKYAVFNFTVYETATCKGYCYVWEEKDGKRGSNEICTNLYQYLTTLDQTGSYKKISLYCDNCSGQNKNKSMLAMLRYFLDKSKSIEEIKLTFLITGHTYMPVDSMHAVIEKSIKNKVVEGPSEWVTILRNARLKPEPYVVNKQVFANFLDFKSLTVEKTTKIKVSDIRQVKMYKNDYLIEISNSFLNPKIEQVYFKLNISANFILKPAYTKILPICQKKFNNLKGLCTSLAIKTQYHIEYLSLLTNNSVPDVLDETDIDDEV